MKIPDEGASKKSLDVPIGVLDWQGVIEHWLHENKATKLGRPFTYSDLAVESLLTIREFFRTTYRVTEGFGISLAKLLNADIAIPDDVVAQ